jgi:ribosomal protein L11 methylase PrmA
LANINLNIIAENIQAIKNACKEHTQILFSGIMLHDKENIVTLLNTENFKIVNIVEKDNWLCISASV